MIAFLMGPMMFLSTGIFLAGMIYRIRRFSRLAAKRNRQNPAVFFPEIGNLNKPNEKKSVKERFFHLRRRHLPAQPLTFFVSIVFHVLLFMVPFFLPAHNILLKLKLRIGFISFKEGAGDILTILFLMCCLYFLCRRISVVRVRSISSTGDYAILLLAFMPFATGFMAYHQLFDYHTMMILHILSGEVMLIALPFTKLVHMLVYVFSRWNCRFSLLNHCPRLVESPRERDLYGADNSRRILKEIGAPPKCTAVNPFDYKVTNTV